MTIAPEPWLAAYITIAVSLLIGLVIAYRLPPSHTPLHTASRDTVRDLETRYEQYIAQLRDVSQQQHRLTQSGYHKERAEYEALAQATLQKLEDAKKQVAMQAEPHARPSVSALPDATAMPFWARHPQLKGALWGAGVVSLAVFLYTSVRQEGHIEAASAPGAAPGPMMAAGAAPRPGDGVDGEEMKSLAEQIKSDPDDVDKLLRFAHMLLRAQMLEEARTINDRALRLRPNDLEALTHAAVLSASAGDTASSDIGLDMVLKKDPSFIEAWFFRGMLAMQRGDTARVEASFTAYLKHAPPGAQRERIAGMLARMQNPGGG